MNKKIITSALIASLAIPVGMTPVVNAAPQAPGAAQPQTNATTELDEYLKKIGELTPVLQIDLTNYTKELEKVNNIKKYYDDNKDKINEQVESEKGKASQKYSDYNDKSPTLDEIAKKGEILKDASKIFETLVRLETEKGKTLDELKKIAKDLEPTIGELKKKIEDLLPNEKNTLFGEDLAKSILNELNETKKNLNALISTPSPSPSSSTSSSTYYVGTAGGYASTTTVAKTTTTPTTETKPVETTPKLISADVQTGALFPNFKKSSAELVSSLNDPRLLAMQKQFGDETTEAKNKPLTRGEFLSMVIDTALVDVSKVDTSKLAFTDVKKDEKLAKYIAFAVSKNIISGYDNNTFRADNTISRAEATKILVEAIGMKPRDKQTQFTDVLPLNTLGGYIQTAYNNKLIHGTSLTTFEPNRTISKAELIKILFNITVSK